MEDKSSEINAPIIREEDVMEVTQQRVTTGEILESVQLEKEAENQGDYFEKKIKEIDSELMRFELEKDSGNEDAVNVETIIDLEGKTENSGEVQILTQRGLDDSEQHNENNIHVTEDAGNPSMQVTHMLGKTQVAAASSSPTWKRLVRKEARTIYSASPLKSLKRSSADFFESELPRKKFQVSQDAQNKTFEVAGAGNQSRQEP